MAWETTRVVATVKAYPTVSDVGENVCVAGINLGTGSWIRLYPLPFRDLPKDRRFSKYATIETQARKSTSDTRPESFVPDVDSLSVVAKPLPAGTWKQRSELVLPLARSSMCEIVRRQKETGESLGMFRPAKPPELVIEQRREKDWTEEKRLVIAQEGLFGSKRTPLEWIPYRFLYHYRCAGEPMCKGHRQTIVDWEIAQSYRSWRREYGPTQVLERIQEQWTTKLWAPHRESYIYTGNQLARPTRFLVLGVFWPPKPDSTNA